MRLKKVFAGALAAAMLVCAVAVPAFAAEEVEQENCLTSSYVQMNIPYADFYKAAGVDNASEIDAVTSATKNKTRAGNLAAGSYHVNADGTDITGVSFPVKVLTPWALKNAKQVTDADSYDITVTLKGKESTTTYTGADALFENESYAYYKLSETPAYYITAWYNLLSGKWEFGKVHATETTVEGTTVELNTNGHHATYEMKLSGFDLDYKANKVYGVVLTTADGSEYGLHHVTNIWHGTKLGFNADDPYFASIIGKTITQITFYAADGVYVLPVSVALSPCLLIPGRIEHGNVVFRHDDLGRAHILQLLLRCKLPVIACRIANFAAAVHHKPDTLCPGQRGLAQPPRHHPGDAPCVGRRYQHHIRPVCTGAVSPALMQAFRS